MGGKWGNRRRLRSKAFGSGVIFNYAKNISSILISSEMPRKKIKTPPTGPSHFNVIYKPPSHSANNNTSNQKQIQQHIPTHTTGKHQLVQAEKQQLPPLATRTSQPSLGAPAHRQVSLHTPKVNTQGTFRLGEK